jgi:hypothetical protein
MLFTLLLYHLYHQKFLSNTGSYIIPVKDSAAANIIKTIYVFSYSADLVKIIEFQMVSVLVSI